MKNIKNVKKTSVCLCIYVFFITFAGWFDIG